MALIAEYRTTPQPDHGIVEVHDADAYEADREAAVRARAEVVYGNGYHLCTSILCSHTFAASGNPRPLRRSVGRVSSPRSRSNTPSACGYRSTPHHEHAEPVRHAALAQHPGDLRGSQFLPQRQPQHFLVRGAEPAEGLGQVGAGGHLLRVSGIRLVRLDGQ
jgi:hypothetical protein